ncbi:MAG: aconitate hydratase AcnA [Firmicutes bacterium HGW-Firmicutes-1]|jgi:aconitate hydratase|nr:MAG: aconitate hydratase AcnA [Firmicutes bacterium HGW-Firmicutes-1]
MEKNNVLSIKQKLQVNNKEYMYYPLDTLEKLDFGSVSRLPFSMKVLLEAAVRQLDGRTIMIDHLHQIIGFANKDTKKEIPLIPARILLQDFTGVPVVVDLAAMRDTMESCGGDANKINPIVPVDLVIDHSVMVDRFGTKDALEYNVNREFERNDERYRFLRWAQTAFDNLRVVPPATGIVHQVNLEYLASVAATKKVDGEVLVYPDSLVGTDSHTTMINGLGVLGWGVGGIEAEACMLGQPLYFITPEVVGFKLSGELSEGSTATDLALTITNMLRKVGVVGKFVEFYGSGLANISLADRATVANMAPEYGATMGFFPVDDETLNYLRATGREEEQIALVEAYYKAQGMFRTAVTEDPIFNTTLELDLSTIVPSLAGPKRPQDLVPLTSMKEVFNKVMRAPIAEGGYGITEEKMNTQIVLPSLDEKSEYLKTGSVVIAAITSCTNTSNPNVMLGAGLVAKKAIERGLAKPNYVKSSLTPGSLVVTDYLIKAGLLEHLEALGFYVAGYGCATCIGNSGPLPDEVSKAVLENDLTVASVLSGNRNFEGRIHAGVKANYLASPMLVVAYALAGTVNIDFTSEPLGFDQEGNAVFLKDIWPSNQEIKEALNKAMSPEMFREKYTNIFAANARWNDIPISGGKLFEWDDSSTYIQEPPFFKDLQLKTGDIQGISAAKVLALLGDSVTTDHISPAGNISEKSPAGQYLMEHGVDKEAFNSYGSRRGNHEVMMRGTFANTRIRNQMTPGIEGGVTNYLENNEVMSIYDASMKYQQNDVSLIVLAGKEYGTGSSRDWAAKGVFLLGVKAVLAESYERIHRSNLLGMGVLPMQFLENENWNSLEITGTETFTIKGLSNEILPGQKVRVVVTRKDKSQFEIEAILRLDSLIEIDYYRNGGILQTVLRQMMAE